MAKGTSIFTKIGIKLEISSRLACQSVGRASGKQLEQQWRAQERGYIILKIRKFVARRIIQRIVNVMNRRRDGKISANDRDKIEFPRCREEKENRGKKAVTRWWVELRSIKVQQYFLIDSFFRWNEAELVSVQSEIYYRAVVKRFKCRVCVFVS